MATDDPLAIPGRKNRNTLAPGDVGYDPTYGPPSIAQAPATPNLGHPGIVFNPTGTDLAQAGDLRPASGAFSAGQPTTLVGADGRRTTNQSDGAPSATPSIATPPTPSAPTSVSGTAPSVIATATSPSFTDTTTGSAGTGVRATLSNAGRALGYGNTDSNGVRSFGEGDLAAITARARGLGRADAGIGGGIGSAAFGNGAGGIAGTPELGAFNGPVGGISAPPMIDPSANARAENAAALRNAQSDAASIASRDTRSVSGTAARNAAIDANSSFGTPFSRQVAYRAAMTGLGGDADAGIKPTAGLGIADVQNAGLTNRANIDAASGLQRTNIDANAGITRSLIDRPQPRGINLADGTMGILGPDGTVRQARLADGTLARPQIGKSPEEIASLNKIADDRAKLLLGVDPVTGLIPDPTGKGKGTPPTAEALRAATQAAYAGLDRGRAQAPVEGQVHVDAQGNKARLVNGKWIPVT